MTLPILFLHHGGRREARENGGPLEMLECSRALAARSISCFVFAARAFERVCPLPTQFHLFPIRARGFHYRRRGISLSSAQFVSMRYLTG